MLVIAHRGASGYAPENTYAAFDLARRMGADAVETDVHITGDGVLVLLHDDRVDRTTDGTGRIAKMPWSEAASLDAGRWFGQEFGGEGVPRLEDFLDRYVGVLRLCLEVKTPRATQPLVRLLAERGLAERRDLEVISFSWNTVQRVRRALPGLAVGWLTAMASGALVEWVARRGIGQIWVRAASVQPEVVARAHAAGLQVRAWDIPTRRDLQAAVEAGVDGVVLDCPDWLPGHAL